MQIQLLKLKENICTFHTNVVSIIEGLLAEVIKNGGYPSIHTVPIGSIGLVYLQTNLPYRSTIHVGKCNMAMEWVL